MGQSPRVRKNPQDPVEDHVLKVPHERKVEDPAAGGETVGDIHEVVVEVGQGVEVDHVDVARRFGRASLDQDRDLIQEVESRIFLMKQRTSNLLIYLR